MGQAPSNHGRPTALSAGCAAAELAGRGMPSAPHLASVPGIQVGPLYGRAAHSRGAGFRMAAVAERQHQPIRSTIPARLDRVRWTPFHTRLVVGLGAAWVLDGLSVTIASSLTSKLTQPNTLDLSTAQ